MDERDEGLCGGCVYKYGQKCRKVTSAAEGFADVDASPVAHSVGSVALLTKYNELYCMG